MSKRGSEKVAGGGASAKRDHGWFLLLVVLITLAGGILRLYRLETMSFWMDEAFSVQAARAIQEHGMPQFANGERSWGWLPAHYAIAALLALPGDMHGNARLPSAVAGTAMILLTGMLGFRLTGSRWTAVLAMLLVACSVPDIAWSRQARGYVMLQAFGFSGLLLCISGLSGRRRAYFIWAAFFLALAILTHRAGYVFWLVAAGMVAWSWYDDRAQKTPAFTWSSLWLLFPLAITMILPGGASQSLGRALHEMELTVMKPSYAMDYLSLIYDFWGWNVLWILTGLAGLLFANRRLALPVIAGCLIYLIVLSEKTLWFHVRYLIPVTPFFHIAAAFGPVFLLSTITPRLHSIRAARWVTGLVMLAWVFTSASQNLTLTPTAAYELGPTEPQADWKGAFAWLSERENEPTTIMTLPVFHDLYLGPEVGEKYFLPFSFSGEPGRWQEVPPYTLATVIEGPHRLLRTSGGYVVLDAFSFNALKEEAIKKTLFNAAPVFVSTDQSVRIWRIADKARGRQRQSGTSPER